MSLMDFRVQMYMMKRLWTYMKQYENTESWTNIMILQLMHHMLVFQSMHDFLGGDIPVICIDWDKELVDAAMYYLVELSADKWTKEECEAKSNTRLFDLCVRALLLNEEISYILPFIIILEARKDGKAHAFFTHLSCCPLPSILNTLPKPALS
ncbi:uncharacterized protein EV420DRAFT_1642520 [Desarmillaria tabescens]|uniref:Uncharacterized protein n=1 Tax=Armillaria tabescens TaxID=1929756 RepID=A0AA39KCT3_ARMTA|nr:uncharacterized protein EV420DRAFT_1642520 [Desarmillaria tabescens]KAK0458796.1 hypothetical protein EV420DRAFT_1642520 [Desarmillaria tabescens]